jgi:hypothetical protein
LLEAGLVFTEQPAAASITPASTRISVMILDARRKRIGVRDIWQ